MNSNSLADIAKQYLRAKRLGWLGHFTEAAKEVSFILDAADLMAIASRESNLDPKWLTTAGDRGNGYGLMQADKRYFPDWVRSGKWKDAQEGIVKGAEILGKKWADLQDCIGNRRGVPSSKTGKLSYFVGKDVKGLEAKRILIASYNCGRWAHYAVTKGQDADTYSTGKDYSKDVLERSAAFRTLINKDSAAIPIEPAPIPRPDTQPSVVPDKPAVDQPPTPVIGRVSNFFQWSQGFIDRVASFEGSLSKSRWASSVYKDGIAPVLLIATFIGKYWLIFLGVFVLIVVATWFLRRTDK